MNRFAQLFRELDQTNRISDKLASLEDYFREAPPSDAAWALHFLLGRRGRRPVKTSLLRAWAAEATGIPPWLFEECYDAVGDLAETVTLLWEARPPSAERSGPIPDSKPVALHSLVEHCHERLAVLPEQSQRELLFSTLDTLDAAGRFLFLKLLTGGFRMGVSRTLVVRALAAVAGLDRAVMEHRLLRDWQPTTADFQRLIDAGSAQRDPAQPYPFYLASPIEQNVQPITELAGWQVEWKWDGIRAQLIRRTGEAVLWSRGEEVLTPGYPEIVEAASALPDGTVLDGELLAWRGDGPLPFAALQQRLGRKQVPAKVRRAVPVVFMAYDLLERGGEDVRDEPLQMRRAALEELLHFAETSQAAHSPPASPPAAVQGELFAAASPAHSATAVQNALPAPAFPLRISPLIPASTPNELAARRAEARARGAEGLMLKRLDSPYGVGRERGAWWKWKVDPFTIDAVLIAAQPGHGKRAGLFTDYTFGIWRGAELVSFAKAYSGLTADEIEAVDAWVRSHTTGRHGPVRTVASELVFELSFEGIQKSGRHKSGLALRFPRIARWRKDKPAAEADRIEALQALMGENS